MCFEPSMAASSVHTNNKTLNPHAQAWVPPKSSLKYSPFHPAQHLPFPVSSSTPLLLPPPQQPPLSVVTYTHHYFHPRTPTESSFVFLYDVNSDNQLLPPPPALRPDLYLSGEIPCGENPNLGNGSKNFNHVGGIKRMTRRVVPPRLLTVNRARRLEKFRRGSRPENVAGGRFEWRPKEPAACSPTSPLDFNLGEKTTIMMKNIPNRMRREDLMGFIDSYCMTYTLEYDFLYLPMDFKSKLNLGYAFVNFTTTAAADQIKKTLENYRWAEDHEGRKLRFPSKKILKITWARIQGMKNLTKRFENSGFACDTADFLPVILSPPRNGSSCLSSPQVVGRCNAGK